MSGLDVIIVIVIVFGALMGLMKGFLRQLASILGLIVGLLAAKALYLPLAEKLTPVLNESMTAAQIVSFLAIWIMVPIVFTAVAYLLSHTLDLVSLGWINRLLGMVLGILKYTLFLMLAIHMFECLDREEKLIHRESKERSALYYPLEGTTTFLFPVAKDLWESFMEDLPVASPIEQEG